MSDTWYIQAQSKLQWGLLVLWVWAALAFYQFRTQVYTEGWIEVSRGLRVLEVAGWAGLVFLLGLTIYAWAGRSRRILSWIDAGVAWLRRVRFLALLGIVSLFVGFPVLVLGNYGVYLAGSFTRTFVYVLFVLLIALLLSVWRPDKSWLEMLPLSLLALALLYNAASYVPGVSAYPFSLDWSEANRYYYSSIFFSEQIYGQRIPWPHSNFSRYLMQSVPFLFFGLPLWVHRLWQALMRLVFPYLAGYILSKRLGLKSRLETLLFSIWAGLFLFQGPVFYQMLVIVILVLWLFDSDRFWRSLLVVAAASVWAGFTRINWVPMPGLMAAALYLMERRLLGRDVRSLARYLAPPAVWAVAGGIVGLLTESWYVHNSGWPPELLQGAFSQQLLWYRLWPNTSYSTGIFLAIMLVSGPLLAYLIWSLWGWKRRWHPLRVAGLAAILLVLFAAGLVISVKIGGGTNLHNLDAYLTILLLVGAYLFFGKFVDCEGEGETIRPGWGLLAAIVVIPAIFAVTYGKQLTTFDPLQAEETLALLQSYVDQASQEDGEILFVSERHLLTFGLIDSDQLVYDYEQMLLMEMAMAGNQAYLDAFRRDLESHRFSLIVHNRLPGRVKQSEKYPLAEENNVYLERVAVYLECYYEVKERIVSIGVDVLVPRDSQVCD
jgi:hypothetical protein